MKPYPALTEATKDQPVFDVDDVSGTLVGFRFPEFAKGMDVPGYHLHFLSDERQFGGPVLSFELQHAFLAIDDTSSCHIELPTDTSFLSSELGEDRYDKIDKVEK